MMSPVMRAFAWGSAQGLAEAVLDVVIRNRTLRETAREYQVPASTLQRQCSRFRAALKNAVDTDYLQLHEIVGSRDAARPRAGKKQGPRQRRSARA